MSASRSGAPSADLAARRAEIEGTLRALDLTAAAIEERLRPDHLKDLVADLGAAALTEYHLVKDHIKDDLADELGAVRLQVARDRPRDDGRTRRHPKKG